MPTNLSAKYIPKKERKTTRKAPEQYQNFSKEEKKNLVVNVKKISQKMKSKSLLGTEKNNIEGG